MHLCSPTASSFLEGRSEWALSLATRVQVHFLIQVQVEALVGCQWPHFLGRNIEEGGERDKLLLHVVSGPTQHSSFLSSTI